MIERCAAIRVANNMSLSAFVISGASRLQKFRDYEVLCKSQSFVRRSSLGDV